MPLDLALRVIDAHARAEAIGDPARIAKKCRVIEETPEGKLLAAQHYLPGLSLLVVRCPSTGQKYTLRVPEKIKTVRAALRAVNGIGAEKSSPRPERRILPSAPNRAAGIFERRRNWPAAIAKARIR